MEDVIKTFEAIDSDDEWMVDLELELKFKLNDDDDEWMARLEEDVKQNSDDETGEQLKDGEVG